MKEKNNLLDFVYAYSIPQRLMRTNFRTHISVSFIELQEVGDSNCDRNSKMI